MSSYYFFLKLKGFRFRPVPAVKGFRFRPVPAVKGFRFRPVPAVKGFRLRPVPAGTDRTTRPNPTLWGGRQRAGRVWRPLGQRASVWTRLGAFWTVLRIGGGKAEPANRLKWLRW